MTVSKGATNGATTVATRKQAPRRTKSSASNVQAAPSVSHSTTGTGAKRGRKPGNTFDDLFTSGPVSKRAVSEAPKATTEDEFWGADRYDSIKFLGLREQLSNAELWSMITLVVFVLLMTFLAGMGVGGR